MAVEKQDDFYITHSWDKENMEEYLRYYLDDDSIALTDRQWERIAKAVNHHIETAYNEALDNVVRQYAFDPNIPIDPKMKRLLGL